MKSLEGKRLCVYLGEEKTFAYLIESFAKRLGFRFAIRKSNNVGLTGNSCPKDQVIVCVDLEGIELRTDEIPQARKNLNIPDGFPVLVFSWKSVSRGEEALSGQYVVQKPVSFRDFQDALALAGVVSNQFSP